MLEHVAPDRGARVNQARGLHRHSAPPPPAAARRAGLHAVALPAEAASRLTRLLPKGIPADGLPDVAQLGATTPEAHARRVLRLPA